MKKIFIILFAFASMSGFSQISTLQMQIENMPQNMSVNPALAPTKSYVAFPFLGGLNVNARTSFSYNDVFKVENGKKYFNHQKLSDALSKNSDVNTFILDMDILRGGFYVSDKDFIDINIGTHVYFGSDMPEGLLPFLMDNPIDKVSGNFNVAMKPYTMGWAEFGVGYSRVINDNFRIGIRGKYIAGLVGVQSDGMDFNIEKNYDKYYLSGQYSVNGGNMNFSNMDITKILGGMFSNSGFGIDLGLEFVSNDQKIKAMASVSDFGEIFWNDSNSSTITSNSKGEKFEFNGFGDLNNLLNDGADFGHLVDSVFKSFAKTIGSDTLSGGFSTYLPTRYHAMVEYAIDDNFQHNVSLSFMGVQAFKRAFDYAITAGYTYRSKNGYWQLAGNYTYRPHIPIGIGIGGAYTSRKFQLYLGVDNILPIFDLKNAKNVGARLSMNFFIGRNKR